MTNKDEGCTNGVIVERIKELGKLMGWDQHELTKQLNICPSYLSRVLNYERVGGKKFILGLLEICYDKGLNIYYFFRHDEELIRDHRKFGIIRIDKLKVYCHQQFGWSNKQTVEHLGVDLSSDPNEEIFNSLLKFCRNKKLNIYNFVDLD